MCLLLKYDLISFSPVAVMPSTKNPSKRKSVTVTDDEKAPKKVKGNS
jgi:hypothetical protein